uniref:Uncharacterized protein n=1 Tax=Anguilla anguilla TaxID=7936 RepID=A0A0E9UL17_ANGAN
MSIIQCINNTFPSVHDTPKTFCGTVFVKSA